MLTIGENIALANNSRCAAIDYDAVAINNTGTYIGPVCDVRPRVGTTYYPNLQAAYDAASTGATIQAHAGTYADSLTADADKAVTLDGGYDCNYTPNTGNVTTIIGRVQVTAG